MIFAVVSFSLDGSFICVVFFLYFYFNYCWFMHFIADTLLLFSLTLFFKIDLLFSDKIFAGFIKYFSVVWKWLFFLMLGMESKVLGILSKLPTTKMYIPVLVSDYFRWLYGNNLIFMELIQVKILEETLIYLVYKIAHLLFCLLLISSIYLILYNVIEIFFLIIWE